MSRRGRPRSLVTIGDVLAAVATRRANGLPLSDVELATDLHTGRDTIRRRLREAGLSTAFMRTSHGRTSNHALMPLALAAHHDDIRPSGYPCPGLDGEPHLVRRLVDRGTPPSYCPEHTPTVDPVTSSRPLVVTVTCSACEGRLPLSEATAFFNADRPDVVRFVNRPDVTTACFRRSITTAPHPEQERIAV